MSVAWHSIKLGLTPFKLEQRAKDAPTYDTRYTVSVSLLWRKVVVGAKQGDEVFPVQIQLRLEIEPPTWLPSFGA